MTSMDLLMFLSLQCLSYILGSKIPQELFNLKTSLSGPFSMLPRHWKMISN